jgi:hypothetical protein
MRDKIHDQDLDKLSRYDHDGLPHLVFVAEKCLLHKSLESFSPLSSRVLVDLERLAMMLMIGSKIRTDLDHTGHPHICCI